MFNLVVGAWLLYLSRRWVGRYRMVSSSQDLEMAYEIRKAVLFLVGCSLLAGLNLGWGLQALWGA